MTHKAQFSCSIIYISVNSIEGFARPKVIQRFIRHTLSPQGAHNFFFFFFFFFQQNKAYLQVIIQIQILGIYNTNTGQQVDIGGKKPMEISKREIIIHLFEDKGVNRIYLGPVLTEFIIQQRGHAWNNSMPSWLYYCKL